jgi:hypothetical protein
MAHLGGYTPPLPVDVLPPTTDPVVVAQPRAPPAVRLATVTAAQPRAPPPLI